MGALASRRNAGVEEVDYSTTNAYRYPPKSGCYFGSYFIMGGERFDTTQPEAYLFGENQDLNFLGNRPVPFPYPAPQANEPTKTLKSLVNIRKDSLKFVRVIDEDGKESKEKQEADEDHGEEEEKKAEPVPPKYNIEFTFDSDVRVAITIYYFATEEISNGQAIYHPRDASMNSETYRYKRGANQTFCQSTHIIEPSKFPEEDWQYNPDKEVLPVVIQCVVEDEVEHIGHSHMTFAIVERTSESSFAIKALKQKQMLDGLCYLLQEIYGIENKNPDRNKLQDDDVEDMGSECVICMSDIRDTLILPCRHLCLCNGCANSLRYQVSNCIICRAPFRALLQIRAMRKKLPNMPPVTQPMPMPDSEENHVSQEGVPPGYEAVALIEALNGPSQVSSPGNTVSMSGTIPGVPQVPSLPTSPEETPMLDKRKTKRHSSTRSRHSILDAAVEEEEETEATPVVAMETTDSEVQSTPVVKMCEPSGAVKPAKETPKQLSFKKRRSSSHRKKAPSTEGPVEVAADDEVIALPDVDVEKGEVDGEEMTARALTPSPEYEDAVDPEAMAESSYVTMKYEDEVPPAEKTDGEEELETEIEPLCVPLGSHLSDGLSLPGTPASGSEGSGSSYSSTSSTRNLLPHLAAPAITSKQSDDEAPAE